MTADSTTGVDLLAFWRRLGQEAVLRCPACAGALSVAEGRLECASCPARYPVESGVPLLMQPADVVSVTEQVMGAFHLPPPFKERVEAALVPLTKYRTDAHPEFANFFARFDARAVQAQPRPLSQGEIAVSVAQVECLTRCFPPTLPSGTAEFRSLRLRNRSNLVLYTDERTRLHLSYRLHRPDGEAVPFTGDLSRIPSALRPGAELTVPVLVRLPAGASGPFLVRFYLVLVTPDAAVPPPTPVPDAGPPRRSWVAPWRSRPAPPAPVEPVAPASPPADPVHWFDATPLAEMHVTATPGPSGFPALRKDSLAQFEVGEDVRRGDRFMSGVIDALRAEGVARPRILEVGAGVYPISLRVCGEDATVVVSDISLVMQTLAAVMHTNDPAVLATRAAFACFDMMHPPFADGTFDLVCISAAMHHIPQPEAFLRRLAPLLSNNGRFVAVREPCIVNPAEPTYISELDNGFNEQMFELSEWQEIISQGGFVVDDAVIDFDCSLKFSARRNDVTLARRGGSTANVLVQT